MRKLMYSHSIAFIMSRPPRNAAQIDIGPFLDGSLEDSDPWLAAWRELVFISVEDEEADEEEISTLVSRLLPLHDEAGWEIEGVWVSRAELVEGLLRALLAEAENDKAALIASCVLKGQQFSGEMVVHKIAFLILLSAAIDDGKAKEAAAREALALIDAITAEPSPLRLDAFRLIAEALLLQHREEEAVEYMEKALAAATNQQLRLSTTLALARTLFLAGKKAQATALVGDLLPVEEHGLEMEQEVAFTTELVSYYTFVGQDQNAVKLLESRVADLSAADPLDKRLPPLLEMLAAMDAKKHNRPALLKHLGQALEVLGYIVGKGSVQYRAAALRISGTLLEMEMAFEAKSILAALVAEDKRHGYQDEMAQDALREYIAICEDLEEPREAIAARKRLLGILASQGDADRDELMREEVLLAVEHARAGEEDEAVRLLRKVEPKIRALDDEMEQALQLLAMAEAYQHLKDFTAMEREANHAITILKQISGEVDLLADAYTAQAYARRGQGRVLEGRKSIEEALRLIDKAYGRDSEEYEEQRECLDDFPQPQNRSGPRPPQHRERR
jgi:tetratricopeptide (TPR) repeat protein